ncbi:hypothetical protein QBC46DRAFT_453402 [Diplogelasinospora grovesii]|uniref:Uncharacterized protein n=1 Tax=Diplogelasinospora grovesii TaxID=303347 RepID=A0AAN6MYZ1_9PEZI|nr:hypothetical protein QBC46DRAFT_453402 [Diplogelasinospora grovesii]
MTINLRTLHTAFALSISYDWMAVTDEKLLASSFTSDTTPIFHQNCGDTLPDNDNGLKDCYFDLTADTGVGELERLVARQVDHIDLATMRSSWGYFETTVTTNYRRAGCEWTLAGDIRICIGFQLIGDEFRWLRERHLTGGLPTVYITRCNEGIFSILSKRREGSSGGTNRTLHQASGLASDTAPARFFLGDAPVIRELVICGRQT